MASYLLDTNILLRSVDPQAESHAAAVGAVSRLLSQGHQCYLTAQVLIEFWAVATRPVDVNGLGWNVDQTRAEVAQLLDQFPLLEEVPAVFTRWLSLVTSKKVCGKRVHDARLIAVMLSHKVSDLLTFNVEDFPSAPGVTLVHPSEVTENL